MKKKYIQVDLKDITTDFNDLTLDEAIFMLSKLPKMYPKHINFKLRVDEDYDYTAVYLIGDRLETDKEFEYRKKRTEAAQKSAAKRKAAKEAKEKELYKQLKSKYGDKW